MSARDPDAIEQVTFEALRIAVQIAICEDPAAILLVQSSSRAEAIERGRLLACSHLATGVTLFVFAGLGLWPLGFLALGFTLAGAYHARRAQSLRLPWSPPKVVPSPMQGDAA